MRLEVNYNIEDNRWNEYLNFNEFDKFIENIFNATINELKYVLNKKNTIELSITLTNDKNIRKINCEYRGIDKPTNVLSFPLFENEFLKEYIKFLQTKQRRPLSFYDDELIIKERYERIKPYLSQEELTNINKITNSLDSKIEYQEIAEHMARRREKMKKNV